MTTFIEGGVTAAKGFTAAGIHCGIRKNRSKRDLALILSDRPAAAAAVYTQNLVKGAPLTVTKRHLENGTARAIVCNSGIANTCAADGIETAEGMCRLAAEAVGVDADDVLPASTGVIGPSLPLEPIAAAMPALAAALSETGSGEAAEAIMTTDTRKKEFALTFRAGGKTCTLGGIAKGSGMIAPNMATMLCFLTTDAAVTPALLHEALLDAVGDTFNMLTVDGDTSTNDTVVLLANGAAENPLIAAQGEDYDAFCGALRMLCAAVVRALAADGEGATRLLEVHVKGGLPGTTPAPPPGRWPAPLCLRRRSSGPMPTGAESSVPSGIRGRKWMYPVSMSRSFPRLAGSRSAGTAQASLLTRPRPRPS